MRRTFLSMWVNKPRCFIKLNIQFSMYSKLELHAVSLFSLLRFCNIPARPFLCFILNRTCSSSSFKAMTYALLKSDLKCIHASSNWTKGLSFNSSLVWRHFGIKLQISVTYACDKLQTKNDKGCIIRNIVWVRRSIRIGSQFPVAVIKCTSLSDYWTLFPVIAKAFDKDTRELAESLSYTQVTLYLKLENAFS